MTSFVPVEVVWEDAHGGDVGWISPEQIDHHPVTVTTVGMLTRQTKAGVTVVLSRTDTTVGAFIFIPKKRIVSIRTLS